MKSQKNPVFLSEKTIKKVLEENKQPVNQFSKNFAETSREHLNSSREYLPLDFSPFINERDNLGRLISLKSQETNKYILSNKNRELNKLIKKQYDIKRKRAKMAQDNHEYFDVSTKIQKNHDENILRKRKKSHENSEYCLNSLKNAVTYDEQSPKKNAFLSNSWKNKQVKPLSLDYKQMTKIESLNSRSFKKSTKSQIFQKTNSDKFFTEKSPPLGIYDVDHCKFIMQRIPQCYINPTEVCSHDYYYKNIIKLKEKEKSNDFAKTPCENDEKNSENSENLQQKHLLKKNYQRNKENELFKEMKKQENLSVKLKDYDPGFWDKFVGGIKGMKDHIKKLRMISSSLGFAEVGKLTIILKNNMIT